MIVTPYGYELTEIPLESTESQNAVPNPVETTPDDDTGATTADARPDVSKRQSRVVSALVPTASNAIAAQNTHENFRVFVMVESSFTGNAPIIHDFHSDAQVHNDFYRA